MTREHSVPASHRSAYARGVIDSPYVAQLYSREMERTDVGPKEKLSDRYFRYRTGKLVRQHILSFADDLAALQSLIELIARFVLRPLCLKSEPALCCRVRSGRYTTLQGSSSGLAQARMGANLVLGRGSAVRAPIVFIDIKLTDRQLLRLDQQPRMLVAVMDAFDAAIPLTADFRVFFDVQTGAQSYRLGPVDDEDSLPWRMNITARLGVRRVPDYSGAD